MKNDFLGKLHAVANKDKTSSINNILIRSGKAVATDGYILAIRTIEYAGPDVMIPNDTAKAAAKQGTLESDCVNVNGVKHPFCRDDIGQFPPYERIIPENEGGFEVTLNANFLKRLVDAISSNGEVTLRFGADRNRSIVVISDEGSGIIMPVRG